MAKGTGQNRYQLLIERIFLKNWRPGVVDFEFERSELEVVAAELEIGLPKNLGDVMYALRYRIGFPQSIVDTQTDGLEWVTKGLGGRAIAFALRR